MSEFRITKEKKGKLNGQENFTTLIYAGKPDEMIEAEGLTLRQTGIPFRGGSRDTPDSFMPWTLK